MVEEETNVVITPKEKNTGNKDLFFEDSNHESTAAVRKPWWKTQFFVIEPVLFGTWDGVFTSCLINIFGIVLFLRTGWMVGNVGIGLAVLVVCITISVAISAALSAIGICERINELSSGGIYVLVSKVLGGKLGATVGIMYAFGLCVVCALYCTGFAESITHTFEVESVWVTRGIACGTLAVLLAINLAGVKWVIRLQLVLLVILIISTSDFIIGTIVHTDPENGFIGYSAQNLHNNSYPSYQIGESFFSVFGVFFPTATGIMAGVNMSGDLKKPSKSIPTGTLSAIFLSFVLYLLFVMLLGSTCTREALQTDFMIAEKVSAVGFLWLMGLYMSSTSSCSTGLYGAPRVIQSIAKEKVVPGIGFLGKGFGANKTPIVAICLVGCISLAFILIGSLNVISPVITCNFMLVYACVDYAYFALAMSYDINLMNTKKFGSVSTKETLKLAKDKKNKFSYGSRNQGSGTLEEFTKDMDNIFTNSKNSSASEMSNDTNTLKLKRRTKKKSKKEHLQDSFSLKADLQTPDVSSTESAAESSCIENKQEDHYVSPNMKKKLVSSSESSDNDENDKVRTSKTYVNNQQSGEVQPKFDIQSLPSSWYRFAVNRYVSLFAAAVNILIMFLINWMYALINILAFLVLYLYTSLSNPGLHPGAAASFKFTKWFAKLLKKIFRRKPAPAEQYIVQKDMQSPYAVQTTQLTFDNSDFAERSRFHQSEVGDYSNGSLVGEIRPTVVMQPYETGSSSSSS